MLWKLINQRIFQSFMKICVVGFSFVAQKQKQHPRNITYINTVQSQKTLQKSQY